MASERIRQRAETALEYAKDFLQADEPEDDEDDIAEDDESESENGNKEDDHDGADDEKAIEPKSDRDPKRKKPSKGIRKKVAKLVDVIMHPLGSKFNWNIDFNLGMKASNQKNQLVGKTGPNASTSGVPAQDDESLSFDAKRIKSLEKDNKLLQKYASKFLDECIRLEGKVSKLSTMEGQLTTLVTDNDRLKAELRDLQKLKQDLTSNLETQNEKHRNEVKRLDAELNTATKSLAEMKATNEKQMKESFQLREELGSIFKEKHDLTKQLEQKQQTYCSELDNLKERLQQTDLKNTELTDQLQNLNDNLQTTAEQLKGAMAHNMKLEQKNRETESENHRNNAQLDAANAKITELRRAIQRLESNPFTTTTAQMQHEGTFSCPLCGASFDSLANMQLHAEDCNG